MGLVDLVLQKHRSALTDRLYLVGLVDLVRLAVHVDLVVLLLVYRLRKNNHQQKYYH